MSEKKTTVVSEEKIEPIKLKYRGMIRTHSVPKDIVSVEKQYDFKVSEYGAISVVETGKRDWLSLVQVHRNEVGLQNVLKLAAAFGLDPRNKPFALKPDEALDQSYVPESFSELKESYDKKAKADEALGKYAQVLGISKDEVLKLMVSGQFADVMVSKLSPKNEEIKEDK